MVGCAGGIWQQEAIAGIAAVFVFSHYSKNCLVFMKCDIIRQKWNAKTSRRPIKIQ